MGSRESGGRTEDLVVGAWTIEGLLVGARIEGDGPAADCTGGCCRHGVYMSLGERDRVLANADLIRSLMDETQTPNVEDWFEAGTEEDSDFPGGVCVGTATHRDKCAFLNAEGLCTLQIAEGRLPDREHLKPYYCRIFPLCTTDGRIEFDDLCDGIYRCCSLAADGETRAVEAYAYEFGEILGRSGYGALLGKS